MWCKFKESTTDVKALIDKTRTTYTVDFIQSNFRILLVGHSNFHFERSCRPDSFGFQFEGLSTFLHGYAWFTVDFSQKPLCNDTAKLHKDDILEDITQMSPESLIELLPASHFEMILWANCPAPFTTRTFRNVDLLLKPGGFLVAMP